MKRMGFLDLLRVFSVLLVMYGHLVLVAAGAHEIPKIINPNYVLPIIDETKWKAYLFEIFLVEKFHTQAAVLGVTIFFLITGYLMPMMMDRYSRLQFIANRFIRIYPTLFVSLLILVVFLYFTQDVTFTLNQFLSSLSLFFFYTRVENINPVLWTLAIEVLFYIFSMIIGRFTFSKLIGLQSILFLIVYLGSLYPNNYLLWGAALQSRYILMITVGSALYLAFKKDDHWLMPLRIFPSIIICYISFKIFNGVVPGTSSYENLGNLILSIAMFGSFLILDKLVSLKNPKVITYVADMVYPLYLIHAAIGLSTMFLLRDYIGNPYLLLLAGITCSFLVAWIIHIVIEAPSIKIGAVITKRIKV